MDAERDGREEALESARRVYDRQVATLESIDDKAMRTTRTSVLILGFIAAALTAGGPDSMSDLHWIPEAFAVLGTLTVFGSAFLGVGIYTVTQYPVEIREGDLRAAGRADRENWYAGALGTVRSASSDLNGEIEQNAAYLEYCQLLLITGSLFLLLGTGLAVVRRSYGSSPEDQLALFLGATFGLFLVIKLMRARV